MEMELKFWYILPSWTRYFWCNWVILGKTLKKNNKTKQKSSEIKSKHVKTQEIMETRKKTEKEQNLRKATQKNKTRNAMKMQKNWHFLTNQENIFVFVFWSAFLSIFFKQHPCS